MSITIGNYVLVRRRIKRLSIIALLDSERADKPRTLLQQLLLELRVRDAALLNQQLHECVCLR
jgi:hypothetical protein